MFGVLLRPGKFINQFVSAESLRISISAFRQIASLAAKRVQIRATSEIARNFSQLSIQQSNRPILSNQTASPSIINISNNPEFLKLTANPSFTQVRTLTKFSLKTGKRKTVGPVLKRFKRLEWGAWIRTKAGRQKKLWKKSATRKYRLKQHIFCNSTQSYMLDKMVTRFWRRPKHYVDDPYRPFHKREEYWMTRKKPIEWDL